MLVNIVFIIILLLLLLLINDKVIFISLP